MTHYVRIVTVAAVLIVLAADAPVHAQTPEIDALRALAEQGVAEAQFSLGIMNDTGFRPVDYASRHFEEPGAPEAATEILASHPGVDP